MRRIFEVLPYHNRYKLSNFTPSFNCFDWLWLLFIFWWKSFFFMFTPCVLSWFSLEYNYLWIINYVIIFSPISLV